MRKGNVALALALSCLIGTVATATTITFDEFPPTNNNGALTVPYAGLGVTFGSDNSGTWGGVSAGDPGNWNLEGTNGPAFLGNNGLNNGSTYVTTVLFSSSGGLVSFDVSRSNGSSGGQTLTASVYNGALLLGTTTITLGDVNTWSSLSFAVAGIDKLVLDGSDEGFSPYGIDNLTFGDAVPEPGSLMLLGGGLLSLAAIRSSRRSRQ